MTDATYKLEVDLNRDFDYSDTDENLSSRLISAKWSNGFAAMFDPVCKDSTAELVLDNRDGRLSPERGGAISGLVKGKRVQLGMNYASTDYAMFTGWVDRPQPVAGQWGPKTTQLLCNSWVSKAARTKGFFVPVQTATRVESVLEQLIDRSACFPPGLNGLIWLLGFSGFTELDVTTYLSNASVYMVAETGQATIGMIGQKWGADTSLLAACRETVGREFLGRLFLRRDGKLEFWNRDHLFLDSVTDKTYNDTMHGLSYEYGTALFNRVTMKVESQQVGSAPEVLSIYNDEIEVGIGETKGVSVQYINQTSGMVISGQNVLAPVATTDFRAWTGSGGSGSEVTAKVTTTISRSSGRGCEVQFINTGSAPAFIQAGMQVRGTKILTFEATVTREDADSIQTYGAYEYTHPSKMESLADAEGGANFWLGMFKEARGFAKTLTIEARADSGYMTDILATLTVGARVSLQESQTGLNSSYFIINEEHEAQAHPFRHVARYLLEPCGGYLIWLHDLTGFAELGMATIIAPF